MKRWRIALSLALVGSAPPLGAQSIQDDVRCILLSGLYVKEATDDKGRTIARTTGAFFLGRIDGKVDAKALAEAVRAERKALDPKTAGPAMNACAARLALAQKAVNDMGRAEAPGR